MIKRFCLYGFLKNQRYFEPFFILFLLSRNLSFTQIGFLVAWRELLVNLLEIPSGAVADLFGRRRSMILSFAAYILAFALFGLGHVYWQFFPAMACFAVGEAFRTGTHKAMIFTWLKNRDRLDEKTRIYGYTRSWSKLGSAFSIPVAALIVMLTADYAAVFYATIIPYLLGLLNFLTYPGELDGNGAGKASPGEVVRHLGQAIGTAVRHRPLRRLIGETMGFEGVFKVTEDYLQPVLKNLVLALPVLVAVESTRRSALIVGAVYFVLHLASAWASRRSWRISELAGGEEQGIRWLWIISGLCYLALLPLLYLELYIPAILCFAGLVIIQNFWRPVHLSRFDRVSDDAQGATVLSIDSQARTFTTMILAPLTGLAVDSLQAAGSTNTFWPVAVMGTIAAAVVLITKGIRNDHRFTDRS